MRQLKIYYKILIIVMSLGTFISCDDEFPPEKNFHSEIVKYPEINIESFTPTTARPGSPVTITGTDFGDRTEPVIVTFSGVEAEVTSTSNNTIEVIVPEQAVTGKISVKVWLSEQEFAEDFTVIPGAKIASISAERGQPGDQVTVTGINFGDNAEDITVNIGETPAGLVSVTDSEIIFTVPDTNSGNIILNIGGQIIEGPYFLIGNELLTGTLFGHEGSWNNNPDTEITAGVDGDIETFVDAASNPGYLGYDLGDGNAAILTSVRYVPRASHPQRMIGGEIRGANDPTLSDYVVLHTITETPPAGVYTEVNISTTESYRYIYYYAASCNIAEIEFYGNMLEAEVIRGKLVYEFNDPNPVGNYWVGLQNSTNVIEDGKLKVTFDPVQFEGTTKRRADLSYIEDENTAFPSTSPNGQWHYSAEYPILAMKITFTGTGAPTPGIGNIKLDRFNGALNNAYLTDYITENVLYYDCSIAFTEDQDLASFQFKMADIDSAEETGYEIDWIRTFKNTTELEAFLGI